MFSTVTIVCRAEENLGKGYRMVSVIDELVEGCPSYFFKVKYWNLSDSSILATFKVGTLLIISGRLITSNGEVIIVAERVLYLSDEKLTAKMLWKEF